MIATGRLVRVPPFERGITLGDFLVPIRLGEALSSRARHIVLIVAGALFMTLAAQVRFPIPGSPVPVTGQTFAVLLVGATLGSRRGLLAAVLYLLVGVLGAPVFANQTGGLATIASQQDGIIRLGPTGGYLIGFALATVLVGRLAELGWDRSIVGAVAAMAIGNAVIYVVALPWLALARGLGPTTVLQSGLLPFLLGDLLKLAVAAALLRLGWGLVRRRSLDR